MSRRLLLILLLLIAISTPAVILAAPAGTSSAALPFWHEGEDFAESSVPSYAFRTVGQKMCASGGAALFGTALDHKDDTLRYNLNLPTPIPAARILFRYGRQHYKPGMLPAKITLLLTTADGKKITREITFNATPGWGENPIDWSLASVDDLGELPPGKTSLQLTSTADECDITLDGFFLASQGFTLDPAEFTTLLRLAISSEGYVGLRQASQLIDQKSAKNLLLLRRSFTPSALKLKVSLVNDAGQDIPLNPGDPHRQTTAAVLCPFALPPETPDGDYVVHVTSDRPELSFDLPVVLIGNLLATIDARTAKLEAFEKKLPGLGDEAQKYQPEFESVVGFLKQKSDQLRHCAAPPTTETSAWVAAIKGYPKDPTVWADDAARALAQEEKTMTLLEEHKDAYTGRTGDLRRVYTLRTLKAPMGFRLLVPDDYNSAQKVPFILLLHGAGADADSMPDGGGGKVVFQEANRRGYLVASPSWIYHGDDGREYGYDNDALIELVDQLRKEYPKIDPTRLYCTGASAGGGKTALLAAAYPKLFAAICCAIGPGSLASAEKITTPDLFIQGSADPNPNIARIVARMIELHRPIEFKMIPRCGHEYLSAPFFRMTLDFFDQHAPLTVGSQSQVPNSAIPGTTPH